MHAFGSKAGEGGVRRRRAGHDTWVAHLPYLSRFAGISMAEGRRPSNFLSWISNEREFAPLSSHRRRDGRNEERGGEGEGRRGGWHSGHGTGARRGEERAKSREFRAPFFDTTARSSSGRALFFAHPSLVFSTGIRFSIRARWSTVFIGASILIHADSGRRLVFIESRGSWKGDSGWRLFIRSEKACTGKAGTEAAD